MAGVTISLAGETVCEVIIGGALLDGGSLLPDGARTRRVAILTQAPVGHLAAGASAALAAGGHSVAVYEVPDREAAKTLEVAHACYRWLNSLGLTRDDTVLGIGGGALTDLAGFVAATYLRGVQAVLVPTTLLGAVDASIGGKTAVNVDGKNLVGVFKHPDRVLVDLDVLAALPESLVREGSAEALKAGLIADPVILELYEQHGLSAPLSEIVRRAIEVKADVVSSDFHEKGRRAILNYGHTVGHAIEVLANVPHGDAVAIGMVAAGAASARLTGFVGQARQREAIASLGLPTRVEDLDGSEVRAMMNLDKKRDVGGLRMVLLEDFGRPVLRSVDTVTVDAALAEVGVA